MIQPRATRETKTVEKMIRIYCKAHHQKAICSECQKLLDYSLKRIERCPQVGEKPICSDCTINCYQETIRKKIREVMRFSGPKMIFHHPYYALMHVFDHFLFLIKVKKNKKKKI